EGYAGAVLEGARGLLGRDRPPAWIVEVQDDRSLVPGLRSLGYVACTYDPDLRSLDEGGRSRWSDNLIFVRADRLRAVRQRLRDPGRRPSGSCTTSRRPSSTSRRCTGRWPVGPRWT